MFLIRKLISHEGRQGGLRRVTEESTSERNELENCCIVVLESCVSVCLCACVSVPVWLCACLSALNLLYLYINMNVFGIHCFFRRAVCLCCKATILRYFRSPLQTFNEAWEISNHLCVTSSWCGGLAKLSLGSLPWLSDATSPLQDEPLCRECLMQSNLNQHKLT